MNKKIILISIVTLTIFLMIGAVSATSMFDFFNSDAGDSTNTDDNGDGHLLTPHIHGFNDDEDWNSGSEPFGKLLPLSINKDD